MFFQANPILGQLARFGVAGGISTLIYIAVYMPLTTFVFPRKMAVAAVPFAFGVAVAVGFVLHSRWSFKDHGTRDGGRMQQGKFVLVQGFGLALNALFTWVATAMLGLAPMFALIPTVTITPLVTFFLNRRLVFGGNG